MIVMTYQSGDSRSLIRRLRRFSDRGVRNSRRITGHWAEQLLLQIRHNIVEQGLVDTGEYLQSWRAEDAADAGSWVVFTPHPAADRLEFGFVGVDSLGRHYHDPPHYHVTPAVELIGPLWQQDIGRSIEDWWS